MEYNPLIRFDIADWQITFIIRNTIEVYLQVWLPLSFFGLALLIGVVQSIKSKRKAKPLLGVIPPRKEYKISE